MRQSLQQQPALVPGRIDHEHSREIQAISAVLDEHVEIRELVRQDLIRGGGDPSKGRQGLTADQVLRALIVKTLNGFTYRELEFHLADSQTYRAFCRIGLGDRAPRKSTLQRNIKLLRAETLGQINAVLLGHAAGEGIEKGRKVRVDTTVVAANIHRPTDSSLLWDCVRVLTRLLEKSKELVEVATCDHRRRAKRRSLGIVNARNAAKRLPLYKDLIKITAKTVGYAKGAISALLDYDGREVSGQKYARSLARELKHFVGLTRRVIDQTHRRVVLGEKVAAGQKVASIFESHTDIICKDRRETYFGHKITVSFGASGLGLDCMVEQGNPADSTLAVKMARRQIDLYGRPPRQMAYDGCFASKTNLREIQDLGVKDVAFNKKRGLAISAMVKSAWVYKRLTNFRAGVEGCISFLKRCFGLGRCTWRGLASFHSYVWSGLITANLLLFARHRLARAAPT